ncbi:MAG: phage tail assembly protein [Lachnospiraceae bacterium]|nr:phage tail assembly protein [Lachnospiraceae bacterium]
MEKDKSVIIVGEAAKKEEEILKLSRTYQFEGEEISEIDMSGLENLTADDMIRANKVLAASGTAAVVPETNLEYTMVIAANATNRPIEFFKALKPRDAIKVKNKVTSFFFGEE